MKKVQIEEIQGKTAEELKADLKKRRYSILDSIGCKKLRTKMLFLGIVATVLVSLYIFLSKLLGGKEWKLRFRKFIISVLDGPTPYHIKKGDKLPEVKSGMIIGFNHPSLGEILRLIEMLAKEFPEKNYLFPVTLPWYEAVCPIVDKLNSAGIVITPIVTPIVREKVEKLAGKEQADTLMKINRGFNSSYLNLCKKYLENGDIIIVAPAATRQRRIFNSDEELAKKKKIEPQTMSLLVSSLSRGLQNTDAIILPIAVKPGRDFKDGVNVGMDYCLGIADPFTLGEAIDLTKQKYGEFNGRTFDYEFLGRIAKKMFSMYEYDLIAPFKEKDALDALAEILDYTKKAAY